MSDCTGKSQQMVKPLKIIIAPEGTTIHWRDGTETFVLPDDIIVTQVMSPSGMCDEVTLDDLLKKFNEEI